MYLYQVAAAATFLKAKQLDTHTENQALSACSPSLSCNARKAGCIGKAAQQKQARCSRPLVCTLCIRTRSCSICLPNIKHIKGYGCFHLWGLGTRNNCRIPEPPAVSRQRNRYVLHIWMYLVNLSSTWNIF